MDDCGEYHSDGRRADAGEGQCLENPITPAHWESKRTVIISNMPFILVLQQ